MYKKTSWMLAALLSLSISQVALADEWGCGEGVRHMIKALKLDDAQKAKMKPLFESLKSAVATNEGQIASVEEQLNKEVSSPTMNQSAMNDLVDKKVVLIGNLIKAKLVMKNQIFGILNDTQKAELAAKWKALDEKIGAAYKRCHEQD